MLVLLAAAIPAAIAWAAAPGAVVITIDDDGPGVADTANLFVPFFTTKPDRLGHRAGPGAPDRRGSRRLADGREPAHRARRAPRSPCRPARPPDGWPSLRQPRRRVTRAQRTRPGVHRGAPAELPPRRP